MRTPRAQRAIGISRILVTAGASFVVMGTAWLLVLAVAPVLAGWSPYVITSASMAPRIQAGSVVVTSPVPDDLVLGAGTVIAFTSDTGDNVTHRIIQVLDTGYLTKGDANVQPDSAIVAHDDVLGIGRMLVPYVGLPLVWALHGDWIAVGLAALMLVVCVQIVITGLSAPADPERHPAPAPRRRLREGSVLTATLVLLAAGGSPPTAAAAFTAAQPTPSSSWGTASTFAPTFSSVSASGLPAHTDSTGQTFTFTLNRQLAGGQTVTIDLTEPHRGSVDYRGVTAVTASTGAAQLTTDRGNSHQRTAMITYTAPAGGLAHGTTITLTIDAGITTTEPASYTVPLTRSDAAAGTQSAAFSVV